MKNDDIAILVMTIQRAGANKTTRYLDRNNFDDYYVMIPASLADDIAESYGDKAVIYDDAEVKKRIDFCGTIIESGDCIDRLGCND